MFGLQSARGKIIVKQVYWRSSLIPHWQFYCHQAKTVKQSRVYQHQMSPWCQLAGVTASVTWGQELCNWKLAKLPGIYAYLFLTQSSQKYCTNCQNIGVIFFRHMYYEIIAIYFAKWVNDLYSLKMILLKWSKTGCCLPEVTPTNLNYIHDILKKRYITNTQTFPCR